MLNIQASYHKQLVGHDITITNYPLQFLKQKAHKGQLRSNDSCPLGVG
ncbi:hypothetical protein [Fischerella thermalis]